MLRITADIFSGRPNRSWIFVDELKARAVLEELVQNRELIAEAEPPEAALGLRGFIVVLPRASELSSWWFV